MAIRKNFQNLTNAKVSDFEVTGKRYVVWDRFGKSSIPGLCVIVEGSGLKTFYCVYSFCKRTRYLRIGPFPIISVTVARLRAKHKLGEVSDGRDPQAERTAKRGELTFDLLHARYLDEHAKVHNKSWRQGDYLIRAFVLPALGERRAADIGLDDVDRLFRSIKAPQTANQVLAKLKAVFTFARRKKIVANNPCVGIVDNPTRSRERILSESEVPQFWAACDKVHPVKGAALRAVLLTGQRPGEVCHMRREHIRDDGFWEMPGNPVPELGWPGTKNKRTHRVWLSQPVIELIRDEAKEGFVFASERGNAFDELHDAMREINRLCNFDPPIQPRDLRRTFASAVTERGHGQEAMDRLLNHYKKSVTTTYDRARYDRLNRPIWEDVAAAIMAIVQGRKEDNVVSISRAGGQPG
jgi:integrase